MSDTRRVAVLQSVKRIIDEMNDRPQCKAPKKLHTELGTTIHDCVCDEQGGLFNTGDADLASLLCILYNNIDLFFEEPTDAR